MKKITVSDITLKAVKEQDIELTFREKLAIAESLDASGVDAIELPILTDCKENEVICRTIANSFKNACVKIDVGSSEDSVVSTYDCVKSANNVCLQIVMPTSTAQMEYFYHLKAPAMQAKIEALIKKAKEFNTCVEFVAKDVFRAEDGFIVSLAKTAKNAGACCITLCDDNGEAFPEDFAKMVSDIKESVDIKVFVQPSDKFKLSTACAIASIKAGADGVKTSIIGDYLKTEVVSDIFRAKKFDLDREISVDATNVKTLSKAVLSASKIKDANGEEYTNKIVDVIGKNADLKDIVSAVKQLGYELSETDFGNVYEEFKKLIANKESIDKKELEAIVASTAMQVPSTYHLINYVVTSSNIIPATANVTLEKDGERFTGVSTGDGPIDAAFHAIEQIVGHHYELDDFQVHAVTKGREAVGSSIIRLRADGKLYPGNGVSTDIVGACLRAYINALNKIVYEGNK